jgi:hypothetical protein
LLACTLRQERPELEQRRSELLRQEEELKLKLDQLQEILLQELANAQGDILQNKVSRLKLKQTVLLSQFSTQEKYMNITLLLFACRLRAMEFVCCL